MASFEYKAVNAEGESKLGSVQAANEDAAVKILQSQGLIVSSLKLQRSLANAGLNGFKARVSEKDIVVFAREFSIMISSGLPVTQALRILVEQSEGRLGEVVKSILLDVEAGARLSDAFEKFPRVFSTFFVSMVRSGEASGKLAEMLSRVADQTEKDYNLTRAIKGALVYPAFVILLLIGISIYVLGWVIPQLKEIFLDFGAELPAATRLLIGASDFVVGYWWIVIALGLAAYFGLNYYIHTEAGRYSWDYSKTRVPIMGDLVRKIATTRFCQKSGYFDLR